MRTLSFGHFPRFQPYFEAFGTFKNNVALELEISFFQIRENAIVSQNGGKKDF
jgi:hypothetical protein